VMPTDSFLRFTNDIQRESFLPILEGIYKFESSRISGSHIGMRKFDDYAWEKEELIENLKTQSIINSPSDINNLDKLIELMVEENHILRFNKLGTEKTIHATRMGEIVRTSGNLREYVTREAIGEEFSKRYPIIEGTRWEPRMKMTLPRNIVPAKVIEGIRNMFPPDYKLPTNLGGINIDEAIDDFKLVIEVVNEDFKKNLKLSDFQLEGIQTAFGQSWTESKIRAAVITAGTGLGKTLCFAIPVITDALIRTRMNQENNPKGPSQLLLYPRNDLAKDQFKVLNNLLKRLNKKLVESGQNERCFGVAIDAAGLLSTAKENYPFTPKEDGPEWGVSKSNVYEAATQTYNKNPASIIIASIESFRRRLRNPKVCAGLKKSLCRIVMDEVHLSSGTQGAHHKMILSRVKQLLHTNKKSLTFIGASATIASPREHIGMIWGVNRSNVEHVDALSSSENEVPLGIVNHLLLRPRLGASPIGAVVDVTSSVGHQRRAKDFADRPNIDKLQKTVCFSDSHEIVGNWQANFIQNEVTESRHSDLDDKQRPYAHWFDRPLRVHEGGDKICAGCSKGQYSKQPLTLSSEELERFMIKLNNKDPDHSGRLFLGLEPGEEHEIRGLDTCPHMQIGTCWHFSPRSDNSEPRPNDGNYVTFKDALRSKRHTSKTKGGTEDDEGDDFGANNSFKEYPRNGAYPRRKNDDLDESASLIAHDIAIATPTLEVGVDMDEVSEVITHKAIRNISSYRQKIGRAGREPGTDSMAVTIMSLGSSDFHHYRASSRLIDRPIRDPVPVAKNNTNIIANEAYESVYDYLSSNGYDYDLIPRLKWDDVQGHKDLNKLFDNMIKDLKSNQNVPKYVKWAIGDGHSSKYESIIEEAISKVIIHLEMLTKPMAGIEKAKEMSVISWVACKRANSDPPIHDPNQKEWEDIQKLEGFWEQYPDIIEIIKEKNVDKIRELNGKISSGNGWEGDPPIGWDIVKDKILPKMKDALPDPPEAKEIRNVTLGKKNKSNRTYVSCLFRALESITKDAPYSSLPALFVNPNEAPVIVKQNFGGGKFRTESVTSGEALRFLLPGMWTHRLFTGGKRCFVMHSGNANINGNYFMTPVDPSYDTSPKLGAGHDIGINHNRFSKLLPIRVTKDVQMRTIEKLEVRSDDGYGNQGTKVMLATGDYSGLMNGTGSFVGDVESDSPPIPQKRPNAFSVNWALSDYTGDGEEISSFTSDVIKSRNDDSELSTYAVNHPRLSGLFSSIKFHKDMEVTRVSLGVARSNGPILVPEYNGKQICYYDKFNTEGIRFTLENKLIQSLFEDLDDSSIPYDDKILNMIGSYIITNDIPIMNSFSLNSYLQLINDASYRWENSSSNPNEFPKTAKDFLELVYNSNFSISQEVMTSCASSNTLIDDDRLGDLVGDLASIHNAMLGEAPSIIANLSKEYSKWSQQVFLNTLGVLITESGASMAGVGFNAVGYTFELNEEEGTGYIDFFDDDALGNGSTELCSKYFYLPQEVRDIAAHMGVDNLPTSSFSDLFEEKLGMCQEHILQRISLSNSKPKGLESWMFKEIQDLRDNNSGHWNEHEIKNTREASLMNLRRFAIANDDESLEKELELAFNLCSSGCVACQGDFFSNLFPPHLARYSTNRGIVDDVISKFRSNGYMKEIENQSEIIQNVGKVCQSELTFGGKSGDGKRTIIRPVKLGPGVRTTPVWIRDMEPPNILDWWVRIQEVI
jgi:hypothetical protein